MLSHTICHSLLTSFPTAEKEEGQT
jgi:hypothetical protein